MMSIVFASDDGQIRQLLVLTAVASVVLAAVLAHTGRGGRVVAGLLAVVGAAGVLGLTLSPVGGLPGDGCSLETGSPLDDVPNVALFFVPMIFAVVATRRPFTMLLLGPVASAAIEYAQAAIPELGRRCDANDLLANSAGSTAAVALGSVILLTAVLGRTREPHSGERDAPASAGGPRERELHSLR